MKVLLDTHVLIWWDAGQKLSTAAIKAIQQADDVYVSVASAWEIAIKASLGCSLRRLLLKDSRWSRAIRRSCNIGCR